MKHIIMLITLAFTLHTTTQPIEQARLYQAAGLTWLATTGLVYTLTNNSVADNIVRKLNHSNSLPLFAIGNHAEFLKGVLSGTVGTLSALCVHNWLSQSR